MKARISFRVGVPLWAHAARRRELLAFLADYRDTVTELAFFTGFTHPPLPLATIRDRAAALGPILAEFRAAGFSTGINHLATLGHLDENLENSLAEPWQHLVDLDGAVSRSCYCASDPAFQGYVRAGYQALAAAAPEFIWVDDDLRLESHGPNVNLGCFCAHCLARFAQETGQTWTREALRDAFQTGAPEARLTRRRAWQEHNRAYLAELLTLIRQAVDEVNPQLALGLMTGEIAYSGYGFARWAAALAGARQLPVKWRPGGGFYTDDHPAGLLGKAHSTGRQVGLLPAAVTDVQYEHENFPYQVLKKSRTVFVTEVAAAIGAGCTGVALNCLGIVSDPLDEYRPYFDGVRDAKTFADQAVAAFGRRPCEGVWPAFTLDHVAASALDGPWSGAAQWGGDFGTFHELAEIGLPPAYTAAGAVVTLLAGGTAREFSRDELLKLLAGGVLLDGPALLCLEGLGLGEHTGFAVRERKEKDTIEAFATDELNGRFAGWHRDCRPSFWGETSYLLQPLTPRSRVLATLEDFTPKDWGPCAGSFENALGGRVAVLGYYPWRSLQSLAKSSQLRTLCRWLARDRLPAYVASFHKAALWCRRDRRGNPALLAVNASLDPALGLTLAVHGDLPALRTRGLGGRARRVARQAVDGAYSVFVLPPLGPWQPLLCTAAP